MKFFRSTISFLTLAAVLGYASSAHAEDPPSFKLAWSEYPSWSAFGVASKLGLINGKKGKLGEIEKKYNVDIVLKQAEYDPCLTLYNTGAVDAVCITNMDVLNPSTNIPSVAILPTSTSKGGDALIVTKDIKTVDDLKGHKIYGLEKSVSEYCFVRNLQLLGKKEADYKFTNMDPGAAAQAMQVKDKKVKAIVVWNPFVMQTLKNRDDVHVLFDSSKIPGEIIDMVVVSEKSLAMPGGDRFAKAICEAFYKLNEKIEAKDTRKKMLRELGRKFSDLNAEEMEQVVKATVFYKTAKEGMALFEGVKLKATMKTVIDFCKNHDVINKDPMITYGPEKKDGSNLRFDSSYMKAVAK